MLSKKSLRFKEQLLHKYPEFEDNLKICTQIGYKEEYFETVQSSPVNSDISIHITTQGSEITVGMNEYHTHFEYGHDEDEDIKLAMDFLESLMNDEIGVAIVYKDDKWKMSCQVSNDSPISFDTEDVVKILSWRGNFKYTE